MATNHVYLKFQMMITRNIRLRGMMLGLFIALAGHVFTQAPSPDEYFGFVPGTDRMLFNYEQLVGYLKALDENSPRLKLVAIGNSPLGKEMYIAFISSEKNIADLEKLKEINRRLALDPVLDDREREEMVRNGKVFILATLSMHSTEVGPTQSAPLIAFDLVTTSDSARLSWLDKVVYMMVPNHNPDGMDMVVENYLKYKGTKYEGSSMPGVYHKYVGHDNNRDFVTLSQSDTRAIADIYNKDWFPQVMVEKHQMGASGVRYFVPPPHDPIAENVDAGIWSWIGLFGSNMMKDMTAAGQKGVAQRYLFDDYWPGSTETCIWKNVIGMLTECASAKIATPVYVEPNELRVWGKGLSEYEKSINMPEPWPGGWWKLADIIRYEITSTYSIIKTSAANRADILRFRNDICRTEVELGKTVAPYYYVVPLKQHDEGEMVRLVNLLLDHGIDAYISTEDFIVGEKKVLTGDVVIPLAQPFRAFIKEVMENQKYPLRHYTPNGEIIRPYDIASWSLPLHNGVNAFEIDTYEPESYQHLQKITGKYSRKEGLMSDFWGMAFTANSNESYKAAFRALDLGFKVQRTTGELEHHGKKIPEGSFIVYGQSGQGALNEFYSSINIDPVYLEERIDFSGKPLEIPRIALVETNMHDMDAGWTRFLFDSYYLPYQVLKPGAFEETDLASLYDVIIFPSTHKEILLKGKYKSGDDDYYILDYPPEFTKGMGDKGMEKLMTFLDQGGVILSWGSSTALFDGTLKIDQGDEKEEFMLPFSDISSRLKDLYIPGSMVGMNLTEGHSLTLGMPEKTAVFFRGKPVFSTSIPNFDMDRRVIGTFFKEDILLSGYAENEEQLSKETAMVWLRKGKGQIVLYAFNPQFRASTAADYKLLFNALLLPQP